MFTYRYRNFRNIQNCGGVPVANFHSVTYPYSNYDSAGCRATWRSGRCLGARVAENSPLNRRLKEAFKTPKLASLLLPPGKESSCM